MFFPLLHLVLHGIIPGITVFLAFRKIWLKTLLILEGAMVIDLDHLLASPVYEPDHCSSIFHPLPGNRRIYIAAVCAQIQNFWSWAYTPYCN